MRFDQQRGEWLSLPFAAADRECTQRYAMVALSPCNEVRALRFPTLDKKLARQFKRRLDGLRTAADEQHMVDAFRRMRDEIVGGVTPIVGGYVEPSQTPGIGVEIDFAAAARRPYADAPPIQWRHHDGAVADW